MAIPKELLELTSNRAPCTVVYGGGGLNKTLGIHALPPPVFMADFEGGDAALLPWVRRRRKWDEASWTNISQEARKRYFDMLPAGKHYTGIAPNPYIDVVWYDNLSKGSYSAFVADVGSLDTTAYNSFALDSLMEFNFDVKTFMKPVGMELEAYGTGQTPWDGIQERCGIQLRKLKNYRDAGVCIYLTGQELIDKDYVTDPRSKAKGAPTTEPFSVKGTVAVPGQLVNLVQHITDLMFHARFMSGAPAWVTQSEPLTSGDANWEAKDRWGRITEKYIKPNMRTVMKMLYGEDVQKKIYEYGRGMC